MLAEWHSPAPWFCSRSRNLPRLSSRAEPFRRARNLRPEPRAVVLLQPLTFNNRLRHKAKSRVMSPLRNQLVRNRTADSCHPGKSQSRSLLAPCRNSLAHR